MSNVPDSHPGELGIVVIGRNEGQRLARSLDSVLEAGAPIVYVDSQSSDASVALARARGVLVHQVDPARPMNAARSRNEGFARLEALCPGLRWVQFLDGDTALDPGWLTGARRAMEADPRLGIAAGHLAERQAGRSVFHLLCALEWRRDPGPTEATGGIFLARVEAFRTAGGFDGTVPSGEEAELCQRVRRAGHAVEHLDLAMGTHDIGEIGVSHWWMRNLRTGHAYANGLGGGRFTRELRSSLFWGLLLPALALLPAAATRGASLLLLLGWPMLALRIQRHARGRGWSRREALWYGTFSVLAKVPEALGALRYAWERARGLPPRLVHYR